MREKWLTQPLRLLWWVFFQPTVWAKQQQALGVKTDSRSDFSILSVRKDIRSNPNLREHLIQMFLANFYGLAIGLLTFMPLAEAIRIMFTPNATFNISNVALGVTVGVAVGVVFGVAGGLAGGLAFGVAVGVAFGLAVGVAGGVVGIVVGGLAVGVAGGVALGVALGVTVGVVGGLLTWFELIDKIINPIQIGFYVAIIDIFIIWLLYFRIPFYLIYLPWNTFLYLLLRNSLGNTVSLYRWSPQNKDELIWLRLFFLDGQLVLLTQADRSAGLAAIDQVASSFRQSWAAQKAIERLLLQEFKQINNLLALTSIRQTVSW